MVCSICTIKWWNTLKKYDNKILNLGFLILNQQIGWFTQIKWPVHIFSDILAPNVSVDVFVLEVMLSDFLCWSFHGLCEYFIPSDSFCCQLSDMNQSAAWSRGAWSCVIIGWERAAKRWGGGVAGSCCCCAAMQLSYISGHQVYYTKNAPLRGLQLLLIWQRKGPEVTFGRLIGAACQEWGC